MGHTSEVWLFPAEAMCHQEVSVTRPDIGGGGGAAWAVAGFALPAA